MSLYRQVRRSSWRSMAAVAVLSVFTGFVVGLVVGSGGEERVSVRAALTDMQSELDPALNGLELVRIEYRQAVREGRVVAATEYDAASQDLDRVRAAYRQVAPDLAALEPRFARSARAALDRLDGLVRQRASPEQVSAASKRAARALRQAALLTR